MSIATRYLPQFKCYPAYRNSGVEWLGEIPAHWPVTKMWDVAGATSGATPPKETLRFWDGDIPWVSPKDMKRRFLDSSEDTVSVAAISEAGLKLIPNPAVLVVVRGMILAHSFPVGVTRVPVTINQDMKALRLRGDVHPEFFAYWLEGTGRNLRAVLVEEAAHGTKAIRMDRWRVMPVEIPPEEEQRAIVAFLDRETVRIDALVAKKERLIELLQEKRAALITRAVTKGLDPGVRMKNSGVEWLGEIPAHWKVKKVKRLSLVRRGASPRPIDDPIYFEEEGEYAWVRIADVTASERYLESTTQRLSALARIMREASRNEFRTSVLSSVDARVAVQGTTGRGGKGGVAGYHGHAAGEAQRTARGRSSEGSRRDSRPAALPGDRASRCG